MKFLTGLSAFAVLLWLLIMQDQVCGKRILVVTPAPSFSHQIIHRAICLALNKRGHELVVITPNPLKEKKPANYREIDVSFLYKLVEKKTLADIFLSSSRYDLDTFMQNSVTKITFDIYNHTEVQKLYAPENNEKFDLIIVEPLMGPGLYAFAHRFKAPVIGLLSVDLHMHHHYSMASPLIPSHPSSWEFYGNTGTDVTFWQRVKNFIEVWVHIYRWFNHLVAEQDKIVKNFLGHDTPYVGDFGKNVSLYLVNHQQAIAYARPQQPNVVYFTSIHLDKNPPPLPKDMKEFLDSATDGFIYMSLGTNMKASELSPDKLNAFIRVFSRLHYKVLWKYEGDELPKSLNNVLTRKWIPQQSVMAHPNIKLFIYQGGLQSTEEAVHYAVPVVGIPIMFDQGYRVMKLNSLGVGRLLDLDDVTEEALFDAVNDVLTDKRYKTRMEQLRALIKDKPNDSVENAVWWIEHVMRHKGAEHLRYSGVDEPWYIRYDMDVVAFFAVILFILSIVMLTVLIWAAKCILVSLTTEHHSCSTSNHKKSE